jgi:hypothetical protein
MKKVLVCSILVIFFVVLACAQSSQNIVGKDHFVVSNGLKVYLWEKYHRDFKKSFKQSKKIVLLAHGKTWSGRPDFDLQIRDY